MSKKNTKKPVYNFSLKNEEDIGTEWDIKCSYYRGKVIHYIIELEDITEWIIIDYFVKKDNKLTRAKFRASILTQERFNLMFKYSVMSFIIRNEFPDFLKNKPYFLTTYEEMILKRNDFAHHKFINAQQFENKNTLMLVQPKSKNGDIDANITFLYEQFLKEFYGKFYQIRIDLLELLDIVKKRNKKKR